MGIFSCFWSLKKEEDEQDKISGVKGVGEFRIDCRVSSVNDSKLMEGCESKGEMSVHTESSSRYNSVRIFSLHELADATKNFRLDCLLGQGGFGRVYKARLADEQVVAVKQLDLNGLQGNSEFLVEVLMLSLLHHPNLVNLMGYCVDGDQRMLVYEYMPLGSLEDHLHDLPSYREPLDWTTRMKIAAGAAAGLEYLHDKAHPPVIYRDFKPSNILLDEGYVPKLSDFGLAKLGPIGDKTHVTTRIMGTQGYCAPEYAMTGKLTVSSDIYSFGVVFLELITGRRAIDSTRPPEEQDLVAWARPLFRDQRNFRKMADPFLQGRFPKRGLYRALAIAAMCLQEKAKNRPPIKEVVAALSYLASQTYVWNSATAQSNWAGPSSTRVQGGQHRAQMPRRRELATLVEKRGDTASLSPWIKGSDESETQESQRHGSYRTGRGRVTLNGVDRQHAVAEANAWVEASKSKEKAGKIH